jgi:hypothetical protein
VLPGTLAYLPGLLGDMFNSQKWQVLFPLLMLPLFMLALLRTELRWRECASDESRVCFNYPLYLPYEIRQQIDVHWIATLPAGILQLYPASISPERDRARHLQWPRILITILSCGMIWYLIGLWAQQLRNAKPLSERGRFARFSVLTLVVLLVPFSCFAVYLGMRGGYEGPTMTDAGLVMPAILAITALVDLKLLPAALRRRTLRTGVALMLLLLYAWADGSYQAQSKRYQDRETASSEKTSTEPGVVSFSFPFVPQPETVEGLALHTPALLIAELPGFFVKNSRANPVVRVFRAVIVWAYWFSIFYLLGPRQSGASRTFRKVRPWLRGICAAVCVLASLAWLAGNSAHGPNPSFGFMFGTLIPIYALRPTE